MRSKRTAKQTIHEAIRYLDSCECAGSFGRGKILQIISDLRKMKHVEDQLRIVLTGMQEVWDSARVKRWAVNCGEPTKAFFKLREIVFQRVESSPKSQRVDNQSTKEKGAL